MAAEDTKGKKRKGAPNSAPKAKKPRQSDDNATAASKPVKAPKATPAAPAPVDTKSVKTKSLRKQAADFFDDEAPAAAEPAKAIKGKKGKAAAAKANGEVSEPAVAEVDAPKPKAKAKKGKQADAAPVEEPMVEAQEEVSGKKSKKAKGGKKQEEPKEEILEVAPASDDAEESAVEDDQTAALLAGFESDGDSEDPDEDLDFDDDVHVPALTKSQRKAIEKAEQASQSNKPGVIYVGRVPRGFFEAQMKKYFSQFGKVNHLRLSRNKKTGASKHYAFVEFASGEVADIVARTMDNYLMFGHILKCKLIPAEQVHPDLFKGAGQRFKVDPRNKKAGLEMERGVERPQWEKRVANEKKRRTGRNKQLKEEFGYEYTAPELKAVEDVPKRTSALETEEPQQLLTEAPVEEAPVAEQPKGKKGKKGAKAQEEVQPTEVAQPIPAKKSKKAAKGKAVDETNGEVEVAADVVEPVADKKSNKGRKRKSDVALEVTSATEDNVTAEPAVKSKKPKKGTKPDTITEAVEEKTPKAKPEQQTTAKPKKAKKAKA